MTATPGQARLVAADDLADADVAALGGLWREAWAASYRDRLTDAGWAKVLRDLDDPRLRSMTPAPPGWFAILDDPSRPDRASASAVARLAQVEGAPRLYVWGVYVRPDRLRRGLGAAVLRAALAPAPQDAVAELTTLDASPGARAFYLAARFSLDEPREVVLGDETFPGRVMRARVGAALAALARFDPI